MRDKKMKGMLIEMKSVKKEGERKNSEEQNDIERETGKLKIK